MSAYFGTYIKEEMQEDKFVFNVYVEASVYTWHKEKRIDFDHSRVVFSTHDKAQAEEVYDQLRNQLK